jgi:hypothetical protein
MTPPRKIIAIQTYRSERQFLRLLEIHGSTTRARATPLTATYNGFRPFGQSNALLAAVVFTVTIAVPVVGVELRVTV